MNGSSRPPRNWFPMPLLAALAVLLLYNAPLLLMRGLALGGDGLRQYYPAEHVLAQALRNGTLPFWTPNLQAGFPLFAEAQPAGLYPINVLALLLLPTPVAHNVLFVAHQVLALVFTFCWGRALRLGRAAASWMGLLFALTTWLAGSDILLVETTAWVPLLFLLAERLVQGGGALSAVAAVPVFAMQWLAGFPQVAACTALGSSVYVAMRAWAEPWPWSRRGRIIAMWGAALLLGVVLAAPQLLPQYELGQYSIRAGGIHGQLSAEKSLLPVALMTLVLPSWIPFFGSAGLGAGIYLGLLPFLIALAVILSRPRPSWYAALLAVAVVATVMAFGQFSPFFPLMRRVPGLAFFRFPSRYMFLTQFCLITFFGLGWDRLVGSMPIFERRARQLFLASATLALLNIAVVFPSLSLLRSQLTGFARGYVARHILNDPYHVQPIAYYQAKIDALYDALLAAASWRNADAVLALVFAIAGSIALLWAGDRSRYRRWLPLLLSAIVLIDILLFAGIVRRVAPVASVNEAPATLAALELGGPPPCRTFWLADADSVTRHVENRGRFIANYNLLFDVPTTGVYAPLGFGAYYRLMERLGTVDLAFGMKPVTPNDVVEDRALLDFLNVCYVLSNQPLAGFDEGKQIDGVWIYRNERAAPRAFAVDRVEMADSVDAALKWVKANPERLRDTVAIDSALESRPVEGAARGATVRVVDYQPTSARLEVSAPGPVLLVFTDTHYPGWQARIDDASVALHRANGVFRAVSVPAGTHRVEFRYVPTTFRRGLAIAAIAALATAAWGLYAATLPRGRTR